MAGIGFNSPNDFPELRAFLGEKPKAATGPMTPEQMISTARQWAAVGVGCVASEETPGHGGR